MSYLDHKDLLSTFHTNLNHKGSIEGLFKSFIGPHLGYTSYNISRAVDEVFYKGGPDKSRSLIQGWETELLQKENKLYSLNDDDAVIALLNDYIRRLNLQREQNRMRLDTLLVVFLLREFRHKYYQLKLNDTYTKKLKSVYEGIIRARMTIYRNLVDDIGKYVVRGESYKKLNVSKLKPEQIVKEYFKSDVPVDLDNFEKFENLKVDSLDEPLKLLGSNLDETMSELDYRVLSERTDRVVIPENFPYLNSKQLKILFDLVQDYRGLYLKITPVVNANILVAAVGISEASYNKYKKTVASELQSLSNKYNYTDITMYLLQSNE